MKALWLSRHPMADAQLLDLFPKVRESFSSAFSPAAPTHLEVVHINETLASDSIEAIQRIVELAKINGCSVVCGVFPANVAVALAKLGWENRRPFLAYVPVAKSAKAVHGENREFVHSHWEGI